jgi:predicted DNA-binding transcriptional regulator
MSYSTPAINSNTQTIFRPICESNFTTLPNELYNAKRYFPELKHRDVEVLLHLFSKPANWKINRTAIANELGYCVRTITVALMNLQKHGFASYQRLKGGWTQWVIKMPDKPPATPAIMPQCKKLQVTKSQVTICSALVTNDKTQINETPQTADVVVFPEPVKEKTAIPTPEPVTNSLPLPAQLNDSEKQSAIKALSKISDYALQVAILSIYTKALTDNIIRTSKVGYLIRLVERALNNTLDIPATVVSEEQKKVDRTAKIRDIVQRNQTAILKDLELKGWVSLKGLGVFTRDEIKPFLVAL